MIRYFSLLLILFMLLLLCSCPNDEFQDCDSTPDSENFLFMGTNGPYLSYRRNFEANSREPDFRCDSTILVFNDDKTFKLYAQVVCDPWHNPLPFCELIDHGSDRYKIEISGNFDFIQCYKYNPKYDAYPMRGNCYLYITKSSISSHVGETIMADISVSYNLWTLQPANSLSKRIRFKCELPMFTSTDILTIFMYGAYTIY